MPTIDYRAYSLYRIQQSMSPATPSNRTAPKDLCYDLMVALAQYADDPSFLVECYTHLVGSTMLTLASTDAALEVASCCLARKVKGEGGGLREGKVEAMVMRSGGSCRDSGGTSGGTRSGSGSGSGSSPRRKPWRVVRLRQVGRNKGGPAREADSAGASANAALGEGMVVQEAGQEEGREGREGREGNEAGDCIDPHALNPLIEFAALHDSLRGVVGVAIVYKGFEATLHRHPQPEVYVFIEGTGRLFVDGSVYIVEAPAVIHIEGDAVHAMTPVTDRVVLG